MKDTTIAKLITEDIKVIAFKRVIGIDCDTCLGTGERHKNVVGKDRRFTCVHCDGTGKEGETVIFRLVDFTFSDSSAITNFDTEQKLVQAFMDFVSERN